MLVISRCISERRRGRLFCESKRNSTSRSCQRALSAICNAVRCNATQAERKSAQVAQVSVMTLRTESRECQATAQPAPGLRCRFFVALIQFYARALCAHPQLVKLTCATMDGARPRAQRLLHRDDGTASASVTHTKGAVMAVSGLRLPPLPVNWQWPVVKCRFSSFR